jgi:hypothetical protein
VWRFADAAGFDEVADFGEASRFDGLPCFDGLLKTSDSQPAWPASIGRSTNAAIAAMMMLLRRRQTPKPDPSNFLPDDGNPGFPQSDFSSRLKTALTTIMNDESPVASDLTP